MSEKSAATLTMADFVRETVMQITNGLRQAQKETRSEGVQIFPDSYGNRPTKTNIDFDLAVTQVATDGGYSVGIAGFGLKLGVKNGEANTEVINRVHFSVEIGLVIYHPVDSKAPQDDFSRVPIAGKP